MGGVDLQSHKDMFHTVYEKVIIHVTSLVNAIVSPARPSFLKVEMVSGRSESLAGETTLIQVCTNSHIYLFLRLCL